MTALAPEAALATSSGGVIVTSSEDLLALHLVEKGGSALVASLLCALSGREQQLCCLMRV